MKTVRALIAAAASVCCAHAQGAEWIQLTDGMDAMAGTMKRAHDRSGEPVVTLSGRYIFPKPGQPTNRVVFVQWYVRLTDCRQGAGKLVTTDLDGDVISIDDFVANGGNNASNVGDLLCGYAKENKP